MAVTVNPATGASGSFGWGADGDAEIDSVNGTPVTVPSWTITLTGQGTIDISAADGGGDAGDVFTLYIDGAVVPWTTSGYPGGFFSAQLNDHLLSAGEHTITLVVSGPNPEGSNTSFSISPVTYLDEDPVANQDLFTAPEDGTSDHDVLDNATDADGDALTVTSATLTGGSGSVSVVANQVRYDPGTNYNYLADGESETVTFDYAVSDGNGGTATSSATITVEGVNDDPDAVDDDGGTVSEDGTTTIDVLANDSDPDTSDELTISGVNFVTGSYGTAQVVEGQLHYDPGEEYQYLQAGETATVEIRYTVSDGNGGTDQAIATVTVEGSNDGPTAVDDSADAVEDQSVSGDVVANDTDPEDDTLTVTTVSFGDTTVGAGTSLQGTYGTLTLNSDGTYTYAADADYLDTLTDATGLTETFEYVITDGSITSTATLTVNVSLADDARTTYGNAGRANVIYGDQNGLIGAEDTIYGGEKVDRLYGLDGADVLDGGRAPDELYGGNGIDRLLGGDGNDKLDGGAGNDVLVGGANDDRLTGGEGEDIFVFGWTQKDTVTDFTQGEDKIQLDGVTIQSQTFGDYDRDGVTDLRLVTDGGMITLLGVSNPLTPDDFF